jgi:TetR/AcrR family transcriptional repressor of nem operon
MAGAGAEGQKRARQLPYPKSHAAQTREKILRAACRCFRERGLNDVSIVELMTAAGLTHGGFYAHFASKEELAVEVVKHGLDESRQFLERWGGGAADAQAALKVIISNYLSAVHRDNPGSGCPLPILGPEITRGGAGIQGALTAKLKELVDIMGRFAPRGDARKRDAQAIGLLAGIVGAMLLARATNDPGYSDWILTECRRFLVDTLPNPPAKRPARRRKRAPRGSG